MLPFLVVMVRHLHEQEDVAALPGGDVAELIGFLYAVKDREIGWTFC